MNPNIKPIKVDYFFKGRLIQVRRDTYQDGDVLFTREVIEHPGASVIIPRLGKNQLVLVKQYRHPIEQEIYEFPAGLIEQNEAPLEGAKRELEEETGFHADHWEPLCGFYTAPGFCNEFLHLFFATELTKGIAHPDVDEVVEPILFGVDEVNAMIQDGRIIDAKTIVGFYMAREKGLI
jgi:ADP-ribose pyrophosphatase